MNWKKLTKIAIPVLFLVVLSFAVWAGVIDNALWRFDNFARGEQWRIFSKSINIVLFFVIFTAIYYIGASWALKKHMEAGAKRAVQALAAALGAITTVALMSFTENAMALLYPFAKNMLFFLIVLIVYSILTKIGMEEKKIWAAILALVLTFIMFNASNWFICEFQPDSWGRNPEDTDRRCPVTEVIADQFRMNVGAYGGFGGLWNDVWGRDTQDGTPMIGPDGQPIEPDPDETKPEDKKPEEKAPVATPEQANTPSFSGTVQIGNSITGYFYIEENDFAYKGLLDPKNPLTYFKKTSPHQRLEQGVIRNFAEACTDENQAGGIVHIKIQTNEYAGADELNLRSGLGDDRMNTISGFVDKHWDDIDTDISYTASESPDGRHYTIICQKKEPECGDDKKEGNEQCDGQDLDSKSCSDIDSKFVGGDLACNSKCEFDTSQCEEEKLCGNGNIDEGEECDGSNMGEKSTCEEYDDKYIGGTLQCDAECKYDDSLCEKEEKEKGNFFKDDWKWLVPLLVLLGVFFFYMHRRGWNNWFRRRRIKKLPTGALDAMAAKLEDIKKRKKEAIKQIEEIYERKQKFLKDNVYQYYRTIIAKMDGKNVDIANFWLPHSSETSRVDRLGNALGDFISQQLKDKKVLQEIAKLEAEYWRILDYIASHDDTPQSIKTRLTDYYDPSTEPLPSNLSMGTGHEEFYRRNQIAPKKLALMNHNGAEFVIYMIAEVFVDCVRILRYMSELIGDNVDRWNQRTVINKIKNWLKELWESIEFYMKMRHHEAMNTLKSGQNLLDADKALADRLLEKFKEAQEELTKWETKDKDLKKILKNLNEMILRLASPMELDKLHNSKKLDYKKPQDLHGERSLISKEIEGLLNLRRGMKLQIKHADQLVNELKPMQDTGSQIENWLQTSKVAIEKLEAAYKQIRESKFSKDKIDELEAMQKAENVKELIDIGRELKAKRTKDLKDNVGKKKRFRRNVELPARDTKGDELMVKINNMLGALASTMAKGFIILYRGWSKETEKQIKDFNQKYSYPLSEAEKAHGTREHGPQGWSKIQNLAEQYIKRQKDEDDATERMAQTGFDPSRLDERLPEEPDV